MNFHINITQRIVKYRAYSNKWKKMIYPNDREYSITIGNDDIFTIWKDAADEEGVPGMQFTGRQDQDGTDVYHGDILDFDEKVWEAPNFKSVVTWDNESSSWDFGGGTAGDVGKHRKVIGNIYEHPKLLK